MKTALKHSEDWSSRKAELEAEIEICKKKRLANQIIKRDTTVETLKYYDNFFLNNTFYTDIYIYILTNR